MNLQEFDALWINDWTREERVDYETAYGENQHKWPLKITRSAVVFDMDRLVRFNPGDNGPAHTIVEIYDVGAWRIDMLYDDFLKLVRAQGVNVKSHCRSQNDVDKMLNDLIK